MIAKGLIKQLACWALQRQEHKDRDTELQIVSVI